MSDLRLFSIVLAAGSARRFGDVKQLARFRGQPLVTQAMRAAEAVTGARSVLVTGHAGSQVHAACAPLAGFLVHNDRFEQGLGVSIACAVRAVAGSADGILLVLADQPLVTTAHLEALAAAWRATPQAAVASRYAGIAGVPAVFPRSDFAALAALDGDRGARPVLAAHGDGLLAIDCEAAAVDIDRPEDLDALNRAPRNARS